MSYWAVVPAAGAGVRMGGARPKQYLPLHGRTVIEHSVARLYNHPSVSGMVVALAAHDGEGRKLFVRGMGEKPLLIAEGGAERAYSVLNALGKLNGLAQARDWVLVHDAVRPCLHRDDIDKLIHTLSAHAHGGFLAGRVNDTMWMEEGGALKVLDRKKLWRAFTPQMFRFGPLLDALESVIAQGKTITDEASAMILLGAKPALVEGRADNIKITYPEDLPLAEFYLMQQERGL
ncbi:MAG: 2-C-methyl-D-erythritol 4-phosphate cytidylyltransferase [Pseudomonadota bacterium]